MIARLGRYLRRHHVGLVALVVALSGTAYAADKIGPSEIERDAVRSKHVKDGALKSRDLGVTRFKHASKRVELKTGNAFAGPSVKLKGKPGDLVLVHAHAVLQKVDGPSGACTVRLRIETPSHTVAGNPILRWPNSFALGLYADGRRFASPTGSSTLGSSNQANAEAIEVPLHESGPHVFSLTYGDTHDDMICAFSERMLWVSQLR